MLNGSILESQMLYKLKSAGFIGSFIPAICASLSQGLVNGFLKLNSCITWDSGGLAGPGIGKGKVWGIITSSLSDLFLQRLKTKGLFGASLYLMTEPISSAVALHMLTNCEVSTTHMVVGTTSWGRVTGLTIPGISSEIATIANQRGLIGPYWPLYGQAFAEAFVQHILTKALVRVDILGSPFVPTTANVGSLPGTGRIN